MIFPSIETSLFSLAFLILSYIFLRKRRNIKRKCRVPSSNIPEPMGAWPLIGHLHLLHGKEPMFKKLSAMSEKLGPVFALRVGIYRLIVVDDPEAVKDCFTTCDLVLATRPSIAVGRYIGYNNAVFALAPYGHYWRELRKISIVHLLSNQQLEAHSHVRSSEINEFAKHLYTAGLQGRSSPVRIDLLFEFLTFNIILKKVVGKRIGYGEEESKEWCYKKAIKQMEYLAGVFMLGDAIPWLERMDFAKVSLMKRTAKELDTLITEWLEEHLEKRSRNGNNQGIILDPERTFMDLLLENLPEDVVMFGHARDVIVKATTLILTLTGSDSTSITLTWTISLLLNNPAILKAAQEELDANVGRERWAEESDIKNLRYLQAIVKETLRLYPPAPLTGIREAREDCIIGGYRVTQGTRMFINIWKLHRNPKIWPEPEIFKPERFLRKTGELWDQTSFEYIPFSSGRRSCPAMSLGLRVVHLALARLLQGFELRTVSGETVDMAEGAGVSMPKVKPVDVSVTARLEPELYKLL